MLHTARSCAWVNHSKCSYNKLRVAYNNAYRQVQGYVKPDSASKMFLFITESKTMMHIIATSYIL